MMKMTKKAISVFLAVLLFVVLVTTSVFAGTSDTGVGSATLDEINEIDTTDAAIAFGTITAVTGQNINDHSGADVLTFSTLNSNTQVYWKAEVTGITKPTLAVASDATVEGYAYWAEANTDKCYPAFIDVKATEEGCTVTVDWADASGDTLPADTGVKHARFTVKYHNYDDGNNVAASTDTYSVVFTDADSVYLKNGGSDFDFTSASSDLSANCTALAVSSGTGQKNFLSGSDVELIGDTNVTYVLTTLVTTGGSEQVTFQLGKKFDFTGSAQTQDIYALVDMPNLAAAGAYSWTITLTTAKWNIN